MVKQGYVRTVEAMIAILITFIFATVALQENTTGVDIEPTNPLANLNENDDFRACVIERETICIESYLTNNLGGGYSYTYNISSDPDVVVRGLPDTRVFSDSLYIVGNITYNDPIILRLYYWTNR